MSASDIIQAAAGVGGETYIEDVFSTYLYTGNGTSQTINNGIDLAGKGGMVWSKTRNAASNHILVDTNRGVGNLLRTNLTNANVYSENVLPAFLSTGYETGSSLASANNWVSWTFRKAPKFFDVVTYTGNGVAGRTVAHSLGSVPGMIIVKDINTNDKDWYCYHRSLGNDRSIYLNLTEGQSSSRSIWNYTSPTETQFTLGGPGWNVNDSGQTYVAYLFAHDTTTDGLIQCGSFTTDGSGNTSQINLGWEPQYVLYKTSSGTDNWRVVDSMRGLPVTATTGEPVLKPNSSGAEQADAGVVVPNATGFSISGGSPSYTYIYMAIRRGPMRTPTDGTKVFNVYAGSDASPITTGFPVDSCWDAKRTPSGNGTVIGDRLRGNTVLFPPSTAAEASGYLASTWSQYNTQVWPNVWNANIVTWNFRRAPGFFDVVCYTGTGNTGRNVNHNLGAVPELILVKNRSGEDSWGVYNKSLANGFNLLLNDTSQAAQFEIFGSNASQTITQFTLGTNNLPMQNQSGKNYVAYLFASCPGVSKVGSYTGTGATQNISCGFTGGARFVLIKRTNSTGDWYVWDTARGMVAGTDPSLLLNSTAAEVNANSVYTTTGGFQIVSTNAGINASGGSYIFLAVA